MLPLLLHHTRLPLLYFVITSLMQGHGFCIHMHSLLKRTCVDWYILVVPSCNVWLPLFQVMVPGLEERSRLLFPKINNEEQIMPGYFNAPGALMAPLHYPMRSRNLALSPVTVVFCTVEK